MLCVASRRLATSLARPVPVAAGLRAQRAAERQFSDAAPREGGSRNRRLWRWGGSGGIMGKEADAEASKVPTLLEEARGVSSVACGAAHSAFVIDGRLYTYGTNKYDQLGRSGAEREPDEVEFGDDSAKVAQVALGGQHSAAITEDGGLWTWGWGGSFWYGAGALGQGDSSGASAPKRVPKFGELGVKVKQVACGQQHTLVLTEGGQLFATGKGEFGRLGRGDTRDELDFEEIDYFLEANDSVLAPGSKPEIVRIGSGNNYSAALSSGGELWVWGRNDYGQLGLGEEAMGDLYSAESFPRLVRSLAAEGLRIVDFACGEYHLVVLTDTGVLYEWGSRTWLEPHIVPVAADHAEALKTGIVKLTAGEKCSFALCGDGTLFSWGAKNSGCLALGEDCAKIVVEPTPVPAATFGHQKIVDVTACKNRCLAVTEEDGFAA